MNLKWKISILALGFVAPLLLSMKFHLQITRSFFSIDKIQNFNWMFVIRSVRLFIHIIFAIHNDFHLENKAFVNFPEYSSIAFETRMIRAFIENGCACDVISESSWFEFSICINEHRTPRQLEYAERTANAMKWIHFRSKLMSIIWYIWYGK